MLGRLRSNRKSLSAQRPKSCGMVGYNDTTSNVTSRTCEGKSIMLRILRINHPCLHIEEDIQHLADQLHIEGVITDDIRQFAIRRNTNPARFYLLP